MILPPGEKIVERKICPISGQEFFITDKNLEFYDKISPVFNGKKYSIPSPTLCPEERRRRRLCFRNERHLYNRTCSATGQPIISYHKPEAPYPVFHRDYWFSDAYDPAKYGRKFDFNRPFFEQFAELSKIVPQMHLLQGVGNENSDYINFAGWCKHCYYIFDADYNEKCLFCTRVAHCKDLQDCSFCFESQRCFESVNCRQSFGMFYSTYCQNCTDSWFCDSCIGCKNCLFCANLKNKQFCILNQEYTKEEYEKRFSQFLKDQNITKKRDQFHEFLVKQIKRSYHGVQCENASGDDLYHVKNTHASFGMDECEDCRYCDLLNTSKNCMDVSSFGEKSSWIYDSETIGDNMGNVLFGFINVYNATNLVYCYLAMLGSRNCFGCMSIKKGEHCILNIPYSKQEYEELCGKIIDHMKQTKEWGEFFPHTLSLFGYNETAAQEYFPMTEEEVKQMPRFEDWRNGKPSPFGKGDTDVRRQGDFVTDTKNPQSSTTGIRVVLDSSFNKGASGAKGWNWYNELPKTFEGASITPLSIDQYDEKIVGFETAQKNIDTLLGGIITCEVTKKPFKIIRQELAFYIENGIPIPTRHPNRRHTERMQLRNPWKLHERKCAECSTPIETTYAPERPERVVCEECYRKLVY